MLFVFSTCRELIRTLPMMLHDPTHPEDLDTDLEDQTVDSCRYLVMSRPYRTRNNKPRSTMRARHGSSPMRSG